jgi:hypothetical protein
LDFLGNLPVEGGKLAFALFPCGKLRFPSFCICAIAVPLDELLRWLDHVVAHGKLPAQSRSGLVFWRFNEWQGAIARPRRNSEPKLERIQIFQMARIPLNNPWSA